MTILTPESATDERLADNTGDHDQFAHYFYKADLDKAVCDGIPIPTLCGKKDVPLRNPQKHPVCVTCQEEYDKLSDS